MSLKDQKIILSNTPVDALENYHKYLSTEYSSKDIEPTEKDLHSLKGILNDMKKVGFNNLKSEAKTSLCLAILADVVYLSTESNRFTANDIKTFFLILLKELKNSASETNLTDYVLCKYAINKIIACDAVLLILHIKECSQILKEIYHLNNDISDDIKSRELKDAAVKLITTLVVENSDNENNEFLDSHCKQFMNEIIYENEICKEVIQFNHQVFQSYIQLFYNEYILTDDGTFDLKHVDNNVLEQIDSFTHKGFIKLNKLCNLFKKLYIINPALLLYCNGFFQTLMSSQNKYLRILGIRMVKTLMIENLYFIYKHDSIFKIYLTRMSDENHLVRLEILNGDFLKLYECIYQNDKDIFKYMEKILEKGLVDINSEIRLETITQVSKGELNIKFNNNVYNLIIDLCRDKNLDIRERSCAYLSKLVLNSNGEHDTDLEANVINTLIDLYYINDKDLNNIIDAFLSEYIQFDNKKLAHVYTMLKEEKTKHALLALLPRYKVFNKIVLKFIQLVIKDENSEDSSEYMKLLRWLEINYNENDIELFTTLINHDVAIKIRPFLTGRKSFVSPHDKKTFFLDIKNEGIVKDDEINKFNVLMIRCTNTFINLEDIYEKPNENEQFVNVLLSNKHILTNLIDIERLVDSFKTHDLSTSIKRSLILKEVLPELEFDPEILNYFNQFVDGDVELSEYEMYGLSEILPLKDFSSFKFTTDKITSVDDISLTECNLISNSPKDHKIMIDNLLELVFTTDINESSTIEEFDDDEDEMKQIEHADQFMNRSGFDPKNNTLLKVILLMRAKADDMQFLRGILETQGCCIKLSQCSEQPQFWRWIIMNELISLYLSKCLDSTLYFEDFLGDSQIHLQWYAIDIHRYVRQRFFSFLIENFKELPMSVSFFIFYIDVSLDGTNNFNAYVTFLENIMSDKTFNKDRYFERLISRFLHNLSYLPTVSVLNNEEDSSEEKNDVLEDLIAKISLFLRFVLNKENCTLILGYCNTIFNHKDKLNEDNKDIYLISDICITMINQVIKMKNWADLKVTDEVSNDKIKLPLDLYVKKENTKDEIIKSIEELLSTTDKEFITKMSNKNKNLMKIDSTIQTNTPNSVISKSKDTNNIMPMKKKSKELDNVKAENKEGLRKSKRIKRDINYDENQNSI
ncbi:uncharacterized protein HGUI_03622 [Hanseniaspora guilliermondii]|uniref:Uncharacterized protein n=1 Tax=Hanseniaspora guilliermondii TaxID=56406 RepID=A0A1L0CQY6_9ASCO|nr:uncharacterized protein HGUI_03622 [Hanseniaspora guilliermondii]